MNDDESTAEEEIMQHDKDGNEIFIKDPIYDIMSDDEAQTAHDRLMSLAEEAEDETKKDPS